MQKFKFVDVLKYCFLKTVVTSVLVFITHAFNSEGNQQMTGFSIIVAIISLPVIYFVLLLLRRVRIKKNSVLLLFLVLFVVNELAGMVVEVSTNIIAVGMNGIPWQITYKICDIVSLLSSGYLLFILPFQSTLPKNNTNTGID